MRGGVGVEMKLWSFLACVTWVTGRHEKELNFSHGRVTSTGAAKNKEEENKVEGKNTRKCQPRKKSTGRRRKEEKGKRMKKEEKYNLSSNHFELREQDFEKYQKKQRQRQRLLKEEDERQ